MNLYENVTSRELLHRVYAGEIRLSDFNTTYPNKGRKPEYTKQERELRKQMQKEENHYGKTK